MPSIEQILNAINQRGMFAGFQRYQYMHYDVEQALKIVEAIGKSRNPKFVIDDENKFTYEISSNGHIVTHPCNALTPTPGNVFRGD